MDLKLSKTSLLLSAESDNDEKIIVMVYDFLLEVARQFALDNPLGTSPTKE